MLIVRTELRAMYVPPIGEALGRLLFLRDTTLMAQSFDANTLRLEGEPTPVASGIAVRTNDREASFYASDTGVLAYVAGSTTPRSTLRWFHRTGKPLGEAAPEDYYSSLRLSPDGTRAAIGRRNAAGVDDQWVLDLTRGLMSRLTFDPARETYPVWSPDGSQILFAANASGTYQLYRKSASGTGGEDQLTKAGGRKTSDDWSRDGRFILYTEQSARTNDDLWAVPTDGGTPMTVVQTPFNDSMGRFSPDGKWVAYVSDESGRPEVYLQPFPPSGGRWQVSTMDGWGPVWRSDGRELFFLDDRGVLSAEISMVGDQIAVGNVRRLITQELAEGILSNVAAPYDVTADGQRFLVLTAARLRGLTPFTVVTNWQTTLATTR